MSIPGGFAAAAWDPAGHAFQCTAAEGPPVPGLEPSDFEGFREVAPLARLAPRGLTGLLGKDNPVAYQVLDTSTFPPNFVFINVYDIGDAEIFQKINRMSTVNDNVLIGGIYHAGVEIYGAEWSFGFTEEEDSGVYAVPPRCASQHTYRVTCPLGPSQLSEEEVETVIMQLRDKWRGEEYSLLHHNCLDFANALCAKLGVGRIPGWIDRFGRTASSLDNLRHRVGHGVTQTRHLARTVSSDVEQMLRGVRGEVGEAARREVPRIAGAAQTLGASVGRWGRGLLGAAARALGDDRASRERRGLPRHRGGPEPAQGETLRTALRSRGGLRGAAARGGRGHYEASTQRRAARSAEERGGDDAFLLDGLPLPDGRRLEVPAPPCGGEVSEAVAAVAARPTAQAEAAAAAEPTAEAAVVAVAEPAETVSATADGGTAAATGSFAAVECSAAEAAAETAAVPSGGADGEVAAASGIEEDESDKLEQLAEQPLESVSEEDEKAPEVQLPSGEVNDTSPDGCAAAGGEGAEASPAGHPPEESSDGPQQEQAIPRELSPDSEWTLLDVDGR